MSRKRTKEVRGSEIFTTVFNTSSTSIQTVDNTLGNMVNFNHIRRPKKVFIT